MEEVFRLRSKAPDPLSLKTWAVYMNTQPEKLLAAYSFYLLQIVKKRVAFSVETQTIDGRAMRSIFKELNPNYKKKNIKNKDKFWYDTQFLIDSLKVWRYNGVIYLGIPKYIKHPDSGTPAYKIFRYLEFGTKDRTGKQIIPARPLIYPCLRFVINRNKDYWYYFLNLVINGKIKLR